MTHIATPLNLVFRDLRRENSSVALNYGLEELASALGAVRNPEDWADENPVKAVRLMERIDAVVDFLHHIHAFNKERATG